MLRTLSYMFSTKQHKNVNNHFRNYWTFCPDLKKKNHLMTFFSETWRNFKLRISHNTVKTI